MPKGRAHTFWGSFNEWHFILSHTEEGRRTFPPLLKGGGGEAFYPIFLPPCCSPPLPLPVINDQSLRNTLIFFPLSQEIILKTCIRGRSISAYEGGLSKLSKYNSTHLVKYLMVTWDSTHDSHYTLLKSPLKYSVCIPYFSLYVLGIGLVAVSKFVKDQKKHECSYNLTCSNVETLEEAKCKVVIIWVMFLTIQTGMEIIWKVYSFNC